jgi:hypothetical protein
MLWSGNMADSLAARSKGSNLKQSKAFRQSVHSGTILSAGESKVCESLFPMHQFPDRNQVEFADVATSEEA